MTGSSEDTIIQHYIEAAEDWIGNFLNCTNFPQNPSVLAATFLLVGDLYENREAQTEIDLKENKAVCRLLIPYRQEMGI